MRLRTVCQGKGSPYWLILCPIGQGLPHGARRPLTSGLSTGRTSRSGIGSPQVGSWRPWQSTALPGCNTAGTWHKWGLCLNGHTFLCELHKDRSLQDVKYTVTPVLWTMRTLKVRLREKAVREGGREWKGEAPAYKR